MLSLNLNKKKFCCHKEIDCEPHLDQFGHIGRFRSSPSPTPSTLARQTPFFGRAFAHGQALGTLAAGLQF
jgi:hypothetical protein